jgi:hypothetical protein
MGETIALQLAQRPVTIHLADPDLAERVRFLGKDYLLQNADSAWLTLDLGHRSAQRDELLPATARHLKAGGIHYEAPGFSGILQLNPRARFDGEVLNLNELSRVVLLCLATMLPREGVLLLHADTVNRQGRAIAFLGPSGTGKSTAATYLVDHHNAEYVAFDKTVVLFDEADHGMPLVVSLPRFLCDGQPWKRQPNVPLTGLVFPKAAPGPRLHPLGALAAYQRMMASLILPQGEGMDIDRMMNLITRLMQTTWQAELTYELGQDFSTLLDDAGKRR